MTLPRIVVRVPAGAGVLASVEIDGHRVEGLMKVTWDVEPKGHPTLTLVVAGDILVVSDAPGTTRDAWPGWEAVALSMTYKVCGAVFHQEKHPDLVCARRERHDGHHATAEGVQFTVPEVKDVDLGRCGASFETVDHVVHPCSRLVHITGFHETTDGVQFRVDRDGTASIYGPAGYSVADLIGG